MPLSNLSTVNAPGMCSAQTFGILQLMFPAWHGVAKAEGKQAVAHQ